jgi:hypothetical protein
VFIGGFDSDIRSGIQYGSVNIRFWAKKMMKREIVVFSTRQQIRTKYLVGRENFLVY